MATRNATPVLWRMLSCRPRARASEMAGTRLMASAAVKIVDKFTNGTAMPVR